MREINAFERWLETNCLPILSQLLWYRLMALCNRAGWPEWVAVENQRLMGMIQCRREATLIDARDKLLEAGLLQFAKGKKSSPNRYHIVSFTFKNEVKSVVNTVVNTVVESAVKTVAQTVDITSYPSDTRKTKTKTNTSPPSGGAFDAFWASYPRKVAKQDAVKAWNKLKPSEELVQTILAAVQDQDKSRQWQRDDGQYIPYPATWLNGKRWQDGEGEAVPALEKERCDY